MDASFKIADAISGGWRRLSRAGLKAKDRLKKALAIPEKRGSEIFDFKKKTTEQEGKEPSGFRGFIGEQRQARKSRRIKRTEGCPSLPPSDH